MGLESSGQAIAGDLVKMKILQETKSRFDEDVALGMFASEKNKSKQYVKRGSKGRIQKCFRCHEVGHLKRDCPWKQRSKDSSSESEDDREKAVVLSAGVTDSTSWYFDSGATNHMTRHRTWINKGFKATNDAVVAANGVKMRIIGSGVAQIAPKERGGDAVKVKNVHLVPGLFTNLLSVSKIVKKGHKVLFDSKGCAVLTQRGDVVATGKLVGDLFKLDQGVNQVQGEKLGESRCKAKKGVEEARDRNWVRLDCFPL